jgi:hypothetical protein
LVGRPPVTAFCVSERLGLAVFVGSCRRLGSCLVALW